LVFVKAGRLSDEHDQRVFGAFSGDRQRAGGAQRAELTTTDLLVQLCQLRHAPSPAM